MKLRWAVGLLALVLCTAPVLWGQSSDLDLSLHARSKATAADVGLPVYPGAQLYRSPDDSGKKDNDSSIDAGLSFGDFHISIIAVSYETSDSTDQVLKFYRKPLARYGQVLECDHGKPIGKITVTNTGLTCSDTHGGHVDVNGSGDSSKNLELRAGSPHKFRIVGIDPSKNGKTHFGLVYLELPQDKKPE